MANITEEDMEYICDQVCRWPYESQDEEEMQRHCEECPIGRKEG